jgi:ABC-type glycerol-3-phosphate transport system permease component
MKRAGLPSRWQRMYRWMPQVPAQIFLLVLSLSVLYAFYYPLANSFKTQIEYARTPFSLPSRLNFSNYLNAWKEGNLGRAYLNNCIVVVGVQALTLAFGSVAAYAFSKMVFMAKRLLFRVILSFMFFSPIVISVSLYGQMVKIHLINTFAGVILIYTALALPFSIYVFTGFFRGIPNELLDSARIDGYSELGIYLNIIIPLSKPVLVTLFIMNLIYVWNDLMIALLFLSKNSMQTLMVKISLFHIRHFTNLMYIMAGVMIAILPIVILYMFSQKYFREGIIAGALK